MMKQKYFIGYLTFNAVAVIICMLLMSEVAFSQTVQRPATTRERDTYVQKMNSNISMREDAANYYYQLSFFGPNKEDIVVSVQNGVLTFAVESTKKNSTNNAPASSFHYSVPVPEYDGTKDLEITRQDRKVIVRLSKLKSN